MLSLPALVLCCVWCNRFSVLTCVVVDEGGGNARGVGSGSSKPLFVSSLSSASQRSLTQAKPSPLERLKALTDNFLSNR